jgi:hypothetical protein
MKKNNFKKKYNWNELFKKKMYKKKLGLGLFENIEEHCSLYISLPSKIRQYSAGQSEVSSSGMSSKTPTN